METQQGDEIDRTPIYRICGHGAGRWAVLRDGSAELLATFTDKPSALAHAMSLARASPGGRKALTTRPDAIRRLLQQNRPAGRASTEGPGRRTPTA